MAGLKQLKVLKVASDPVGALPDAVYFIKKAGQTGFDIKVADAQGGLIPMNCCADTGGGSSGGTTLPYKSYTAILLQRDQKPPLVTAELQNDFTGATPHLIYNGPGLYSIIMSGVFTERTLVFCNAQDSDSTMPRLASARFTGNGEIQINCGQDNNLIQLDVRIYK